MTTSGQDHGSATATTTTTTTTTCPDPSAHDRAHRKSKLPDQAASAALYATQPKRDPNYPLGPDHKLSSAGAATSLKYARAQDLPSFPTVGIDTKNSGLTAATLANKNKTTVEWWTPELSADASKAALLANNYKMEPLWQPELSSASSKAAMLAHQGAGRDWWQPQASEEGLSAAGIAMRNKGLSPQLDYGYTETGKKNSLLAARLSVKGRKRAGSQPTPSNSHPDAHNASSNALNAATLANASRLGPNSMPREMYTEHPPVQLEVSEKRHQDALQASAISMAKSMYAMQKVDDDGNITIDHGRLAAGVAHDTQSISSSQDIKSQAMQYLTLQDAAQKLAAERLAKIGNQHENAAFRDYWGQPSQKRRSRLSMKSGPRRRASSEGRGGRNLDIDSDDERQARRVRSQMSQFNTQLAEVDAQKRGQDRQNLLAAAERKVQAQMTKLDEKIYNETGKMSPAMVEEWDNKARAQARTRIAAASEKREQNRGKVDIGGGKFIDQSEIDSIAAARVQPTLDHINQTAEKQRARDEEIRLDQAEAKRQAQVEKSRQAELKAEQKRAKYEEKNASKAKRQEEKEAAKLERHAEKEKKSEWSRLVKPENRKSAESKPAVLAAEPVVPTAPTTTTTTTGKSAEADDADATERMPSTSTASAESPIMTRHAEASSPAAAKPAEASPKSTDDGDVPNSPTRKRFSSFFTKLKRKSKSNKESSADDNNTTTTTTTTPTKSFQGGAAYTGAKPTSSTDQPAALRLASPSVSTLSSDDDEDVEAAPRGRTQSRARDLSSDGDEFEEARDGFDEGLAPPPVFGSGGVKTGSPVRDSKFIEAL